MKKIFTLTLALSLIISLLCCLPVSAAESYTDAKSWEIKASSDGMGGIAGAFDNNEKSYWHTSYTVENGQIVKKEECPHIIDIVFPDEREVSGISYLPRKDESSAGIWKKAEIYTSADGETFTLNTTAEFDLAVSRAEATVAIKKGTYKAMRIKVTESQGNYGTAAEIKILKGEVTSSVKVTESDGTKTESAKEDIKAPSASGEKAESYTDAKSWEIKASSDGMGGIAGAFDNNEKSYWHTSYTVENGQIVSKDECPHTITIVSPDKREVSGISYVPRKDESSAGIWKKAEIYTSKDGAEYKLSATVTLDFDTVIRTREEVIFKIEKGTYKAIMIKVTEAQGNYGTAAEIKILKGDIDKPSAETTLGGDKTETVTPEETEVDGKLNTSYVKGKKAWSITATSCASFTTPKAMLDDNTATFWHTNYTASGSTITSSDPPPYTIEIKMDKAITASGFAYTTRPSGNSGNWLSCELYVSDTDDGEYTLVETFTFDIGNGRKNRFFSANINIKKAKLVVDTKMHGTCAEIDFISPLALYDTVKPSEYPSYSKENGLVKVDLSVAGISANVESWVDNHPQLMIDGTSRFWQSASHESAPFIVDLSLMNEIKISRINMTPRGSSDWHGTWEKYNIYASLDGENYTLVKENLSNARSANVKLIVFDEAVSARFLRFEILEGYSNKAACAELEIYETRKDKEERLLKAQEKYVLTVDENEIYVKKNGNEKTVTTDVAPYIVSGSTMIPLRGLLEEMGAEVLWEGEEQKVTIKKDGKVIHIQIWNNLVTIEGTKYGTVRYTLPQYPRIKDGRTFIPLRFVSEHLGYNVSWNGETREITIESKIAE